MKPILFATNYSAASDHAGDYAAQLAKICKVPLIVLHSWTIPVLTPEDAVMAPPESVFRQRERLAIEKEVMRLRARWGISVTGVECQGYTPDEIASLYKKNEVSLVVMGMHHHNFCSRIMGSVATTTLHHTGYPVLLVPDTATFSKPGKMLLAVDTKFVVDASAVSPLKLMVRALEGSLELVYVSKPDELWRVNETPAVVHLEHILEQIPHRWNFETSERTADGIKHAADELSADWIVVAPHHFSWFEDLFRRGISENLAYSTDKPLLILPSIAASETV